MTTKGSKSAPTKKAPKTPAQGGKPEVTLENGTTVVLPNPADAPAPPKSGRKKKPEPALVTKAEVPDWAKRAAARDTAAEMAAVPERTSAQVVRRLGVQAVPAAARPRRRAAPQVREGEGRTAKDAPAATPGSLRAIGNAWIDVAPRRGTHDVDGQLVRERPRGRLRVPRRNQRGR